jgi:hypothetical protein
VNKKIRTSGIFGDAVPGHDDFDDEVWHLEAVISDGRNDADTRAQALVELMRWYAKNGRPAPVWILLRLLKAFDAFREGRSKSVNEALGMKPWRKGRRTKIRTDPRTGLSAAAEIVRIVLEMEHANHRHKVAIDEALFERIGKGLPEKMPAGTVKKIYYESRRDPLVVAELLAFKRRLGIST